MRNIKLLIAFEGTHYSGWQRQQHDVTIQGEIEFQLARMTGKYPTLHGAGRTDAGVHAEGMVANFHTESMISCPTLCKGLNSLLPGAIRILEVQKVPLDFHARFSAKGKHYLYHLQTGPVQMPAERLYSLHYPVKLDEQAISACLEMLVGTHDFASFENSGSRDKNQTSGRGSIRTLYSAEFLKSGQNNYSFSFIGDGFLRQMVRNLVGTLLEVGRNKRTVNDLMAILLAKDRNKGGPTAPAHGLTLQEVLY